LNVVYVGADKPTEKNCTIWNCENPVRAINKLGGNHKATLLTMEQFCQNAPETQQICMESDIIVVERNLFQGTMVACAYYTAMNRTVIGIWDDSYDHMEPTNVSYNFWEKGEVPVQNEKGEQVIGKILPPPLTQMKLTLKFLKGAQVVSKQLAKDWSKYTKTYHVNNYLYMGRYENAVPLYDFSNEIIIFWQGSMSHHYSFLNSGVIGGLEKVCAKYPNVKVLLGGDKRNYDLLKNVPFGQKYFQPFVPEEKFASLLKCATIGLAPLQGEYDKRRSWVKCLEYQVLQIPWVASNLCTYEKLAKYGELVENTPEAWAEGLSKVINGLPRFQEKARTISYDFACSQNIDLNIEKTLKLYQQIIDGPHNI